MEFGKWLQTQGFAPRTCMQYVRTIRGADDWLTAAGHEPIRKCKPDALLAYAQTLPNTNATRMRVRSALKQYWLFLGRREDTVPMWAIPCPKRPRMVCKAVEPDQMGRILVAAQEFGHDRYVLVCCLYYAALRREEAVSLTWPSIDSGRLKIVGKGGLEASLPIHPALSEALAGMPRRAFWVFPGRRPHQHMNVNTANVWMREIGARAGVLGLRPHVLRHTALATIVDQTGDLRAAQELARHADPRTTAGYTRATEARMQMALGSLTLFDIKEIPVIGEVAAGFPKRKEPK